MSRALNRKLIDRPYQSDGELSGKIIEDELRITWKRRSYKAVSKSHGEVKATWRGESYMAKHTVDCKTFGAQELVAADLFFKIRKIVLGLCTPI